MLNKETLGRAMLKTLYKQAKNLQRDIFVTFCPYSIWPALLLLIGMPALNGMKIFVVSNRRESLWSYPHLSDKELQLMMTTWHF